jgi:hypothetical protein
MGMCGGGSIGGAITGFLLGGPVGALAGALIGDAAIDKPQKLQEQSINNQKTAAEQATVQATKQADLAEQANNRVNSKSPDVGAMLSSNQQAAKGGQSSTMLTGPQGVDMSQLNLGKNTLLGA